MTTGNSTTLRVLVVDDDVQIREVYRRGLEVRKPAADAERLDALRANLFVTAPPSAKAQRFEVLSCGQGANAVDIVREEFEASRHFDAIIMDIRMPPGISGVEAACQIRKLDKAVPIIFVSGYSDTSIDDILSEVPPPYLVHYISKPIQATKLQQIVGEAVCVQ